MHSMHKMRPIATDELAWSVGLSVSLSVSVGHIREPCKNG